MVDVTHCDQKGVLNKALVQTLKQHLNPVKKN